MSKSIVRLDLSATTADLAIARAVTASMATRADLTLDQLDDARLAVDEAAAVLIEGCDEADRLSVTFHASARELRVTVSAPRPGNDEIASDTFSWTVLCALSDELTASVSDGIARIDIRITRQVDAQA